MMSDFLQYSIPFLRATCPPGACDFLNALEEVLALGDRFVFRLGGATGFLRANDLLIGPKGLSIPGTRFLIRFDDNLAVSQTVPDHFKLPPQPEARYRRTAFVYVCGPDRTFGMIARDDELEPGRHSREALTDAIATLRRTADLRGTV